MSNDEYQMRHFFEHKEKYTMGVVFSDTMIIGMKYIDINGDWHYVKAKNPMLYMPAKILNDNPELFTK